MEIHKMAQGTQEWLDIRKGKMTASHANTIAVAGKGLETYVYEIVAGMLSSAEPENFISKDIADSDPNLNYI